jgi:hypothetical protein
MTSAVATRREDGTLIDPAWLTAAIDHSSTTSAALARRLEVDGTTLYRWRKGQAPITKVIWLAITQALGLPIDWTPPAPAPPDQEPT